MNYRLLYIFLVIVMMPLCSHGETYAINDSVLINFRQSKINVDTAYMHNREAFRHIKETVERFSQPDSNYVLLNVKVVGGASPEGTVKFNEYLSRQRADRIFEIMHNSINMPDSVASFTFLGRDWIGLKGMVERDPNVPEREEVLTTLDEIIKNYLAGEKESDHDVEKLKRIGNGVPYLYMYRNMFPQLRASKIVLNFGYPVLMAPHIPEPTLPTEAFVQTDICFIPIVTPTSDRPFYMAVKSNMLSDILAIPEIGLEFYLGKNFSIVGNWMYGWWDKDSTHKYWRAYGGDLAVRWWFGKAAHQKPLTGHHIGLYGGVVTYDFEFGGKGYMGGRPGHNLWDRCMHHFGVEYGYSLPIARRFNIDFTLGLGYMGGKYVEYHPQDKCYVWDATKYRHWFGPTKLEVSLVWLIGHGNFNVKKGGRK